MKHAMVAFALIACGTQAVSGQVARNCGDTAEAEVIRPELMLFFTDGGEYGEIRDGRWQQLSAGAVSRVLTRIQDCRKIADAVNLRIPQEYNSSSPYRTGPLEHFMYEFGPYYVILFQPPGLIGFAPMWIFDKQTLEFLWEQLV